MTYYIAIDGSDANPGTFAAPWATFARAMTALQPGDVLLLKDGTYYQSLNVTVSGVWGNPITIRAMNDGKASVNGQGVNVPCRIYNPPTASNRWHDLIIEGIVFKNSSADVIMIGRADRITVRRVSGYHAGLATGNYHVFALSYSTKIVLEDCAASGSGRTMYTLYYCDNSVLRRCWGRWQKHSLPPYFFLQVYNSNNNVVENCIGTKDPAATQDVYGMTIRSNKEAANTANNNLLYGNVVYNVTHSYYRVESDSFKISGNRLDNNVAIQTNTNNQEWGYLYINADANLVVDHQTLIGFNKTTNSGFGNAVVFEELTTPRAPGFTALTVFKNAVLANGQHGFYTNYSRTGYAFYHSYNDIYNITGQMYRLNATPGSGEISLDPQYNTVAYGKGAYLIAPAPLQTAGANAGRMGAEVLYRYQNSSLTNVPLWPWPMESRILAETGVSVTWESSGGLWKSLNGVYTAVNAGADQNLICRQKIMLGGNPTASGGVAPYTYSWSPATGLDNPSAANPNAAPRSTTLYTVTVTDADNNTATDQVLVTVNLPASGWSVQHIVDVDDVIFGINQSTAPRDNRSLALSPDKRFLYLGYLNPGGTPVVRRIDLNVVNPANGHGAVIAQLLLPSGSEPAYALATDDWGRVYMACGTKINVYNYNLSTLLHTISGLNDCEGVATRRENGVMAVYRTDRTARRLKRYVLTEGVGDAILASTKAGLDGDGEISLTGSGTPCGVEVQSDGTIWIADNSANAGTVFRFNANGEALGSTSVAQAYDLALDESRGEVYVSQNTNRTMTVLNLSIGAVMRTMTPPATGLNIDLDGETGSGALTGIDADDCQRVYVANEKGRSILTGNPLDSPFSNTNDNNIVYAADVDPVLVVSGTVLAKSDTATSFVADDATKADPVTDYELAPAYPNPFAGDAIAAAQGRTAQTKIAFILPETGQVTLRIYTLTGQLVRTLVDGEKNTGRHEIAWDGRDEHGRFATAGFYLYQIIVTNRAGNVVFTKTAKMTRLR